MKDKRKENKGKVVRPDASGRVRSPPNPPHIWGRFGGCRTARTYVECLETMVGCMFLPQILSGLSARTFGGGLAILLGEALIVMHGCCRRPADVMAV